MKNSTLAYHRVGEHSRTCAILHVYRTTANQGSPPANPEGTGWHASPPTTQQLPCQAYRLALARPPHFLLLLLLLPLVPLAVAPRLRLLPVCCAAPSTFARSPFVHPARCWTRLRSAALPQAWLCLCRASFAEARWAQPPRPSQGPDRKAAQNIAGQRRPARKPGRMQRPRKLVLCQPLGGLRRAPAPAPWTGCRCAHGG